MNSDSQFKEYRFKRLFDLCTGVPALVLALPLMIAVSVLVAAFIGTPVLFRQQRPGLHGKVFTLFKFRTMSCKADSNGIPLPDSDRITPFGRFLRSTSLDELPELFQVICGNMSIVGPRPLLVCYLDRYSSYQMRRHLVRPGITGLAQVNGRNSLTWEQKFANDIYYVDHQSLWLDLKIVARTCTRLIGRDGIDQHGVIGAPEFMGNGFMEAKTQMTTGEGTGNAGRNLT
jgi:lipopolysaccharide/colanic/teichoic acid biosynthesis glycosyltransferase